MLGAPEEPVPFIPETVTVLVKFANLCCTIPRTEFRYMLSGFVFDKSWSYTAMYLILKGVFYNLALRKLEGHDWQTMLAGSDVSQSLLLTIAVAAQDWLRITKHKFEEELERMEFQANQRIIAHPVAMRGRKQLLEVMGSRFSTEVWRDAPRSLFTPNVKFCAAHVETEDGAFQRMFNEISSHSDLGSDVVSHIEIIQILFWT